MTTVWQLLPSMLLLHPHLILFLLLSSSYLPLQSHPKPCHRTSLVTRPQPIRYSALRKHNNSCFCLSKENTYCIWYPVMECNWWEHWSYLSCRGHHRGTDNNVEHRSSSSPQYSMKHYPDQDRQQRWRSKEYLHVQEKFKWNQLEKNIVCLPQ